METNQDAGPVLRLPQLGDQDHAEPQAPPAAAPRRARQRWEPGETVKVGTSLFRIEEVLPAARKGEAGRYRLVSHDLSRQYIWTPFRGLKVLGGPPRRRRKGRRARPVAAKKAAPKAATRTTARRPTPAVSKVVRVGLLARVWSAFRAQ